MDEDIEELTQRSMNLQCNISDTELSLISSDKDMVITQNILF